MPRKAIIGIDLGTTNTTCYVLTLHDDGSASGEQLDIDHVNFRSSDEHPSRVDKVLPSCVIVSEKSNQVFCGRMDPECTDPDYYPIRNIKTKINDDRWKVKVGDKYLTPVGISAVILRTVYLSIEKYIREKEIDEIESVTITIPASFSSKMRRTTLDAAELAGFKSKLSLLDEPVAAIMSAYDLATDSFNRQINTSRDLLLFDIGGGTVDVAIIGINEDGEKRTIEIKTSSRYNELGGADFDLEIAALILNKIRQNTHLADNLERLLADKVSARTFANKLIDKANLLKRDLDRAIKSIANLRTQKIEDLLKDLGDIQKRNHISNLEVDLSDLPGLSGRCSICLEEIIIQLMPYISYSERQKGRNMFDPLEEVWAKTGRKNEDFNNYIVGGTGQFSLVTIELRNLLHHIEEGLDATFSVSMGAAKFAYLENNLKWIIAQHTNDKIFLRRDGFSPLEILAENLPIPSSETAPPLPLEGNDTIEWVANTENIELEFYQGTAKDDIGLSLLHRAAIPLQNALIDIGRLSEIKGMVDASKVFHFSVKITDGSEVAYCGDLTFKSTFARDKQGNKLAEMIKQININSN